MSTNKKSMKSKKTQYSDLLRLERQALNQIKSTNGRRQVKTKPAPRRNQSNRLVGVAAAYSEPGYSTKPQIRNGDNGCRVIHRELLTNIVSNPNSSLAWLVNNTFSLNPGLPATFPWLANIAQNWERYRFNRLVFRYLPRIGTSTAGSVSLIPDYDAADAAPVNETVASSLMNMREDAVWKEIVCTLDPKSLHALGPSKFVRVGALAPNLDVKTYDSGTLFTAVADNATPSVGFGKLWVEYDVTFMTPQLPPTGANSVSIQPAAGGNSGNPLGTSQNLAGPIGVSVSGLTATLTNLVPGAEYVFNNFSTGTGITVAPAISSITDLALNNVALKHTASTINAAATQSQSMQSFIATATTLIVTLVATVTTLATGTVGTQSFINQVPGAAPW